MRTRARLLCGLLLAAGVLPAAFADAQIPAGTVNIKGIVTVTNLSYVPAGSLAAGQTGPMLQAVVAEITPVLTPGRTSPLFLTVLGALRTDGSGVTQPVKVTDGTNTAPVTNAAPAAGDFGLNVRVVSQPAGGATTNVTQFGGNNIVTGTGASGLGIPRVTVANDSTVTANAGTNLNTSLLVLDATLTGRINTQGQKTMAASTPTVLASDQSALPVTGTFFQATQPVSGTVTSNQGTGAAGTGSWPTVPTQGATLLNAAPTVSAANTAATVTLTGAAATRICVRTISVQATGAAAAFTLTVSDGATVVLDLGTQSAVAAGAADVFTGSPLLCGSTGNNVVVNIGAGGALAVTTTSVIADRQ